MLLLLVVVVSWVAVSIPSYVIGVRRGVENAWVAFIPLVGHVIVWLWSIDRSGWLSLLGLIPLVNIVFSLWLVFTMPAYHGRTRWWGLGLLVPLIGTYSYAFTLPERRSPGHVAVDTD